MELDRELLKGHIDTIILALLSEKNSYGYELAKRVRERSRNLFELKEGTMYVALKRLEKKGFVESYWGTDDESEGGRRKYYRILPPGMEQYRIKKKEWETISTIMKCFFEGVTPE
ncbi:PadR family transcriptional regulator [Paenactinomyces guangxiensis]|uniref:Helix-turn-helix transcriptional regulator n=1 Tax=Paenactinomyces guangxiensis TaxID=1490290 RepID=A0A7W1WTD0_9BACL|nr:helix-turn-helix transcriptional regulator [Paenactinomyces guangxiensis]MBA4495643.1 helix-turn-helix transcriptional regulator [Paenactinomyces guangxiensis]MBH8592631.1 helix-turn-helix transcriptional regulator [Paenactinomyces guangxiensis]